MQCSNQKPLLVQSLGIGHYCYNSRPLHQTAHPAQPQEQPVMAQAQQQQSLTLAMLREEQHLKCPGPRGDQSWPGRRTKQTYPCALTHTSKVSLTPRRLSARWLWGRPCKTTKPSETSRFKAQPGLTAHCCFITFPSCVTKAWVGGTNLRQSSNKQTEQQTKRQIRTQMEGGGASGSH